MLLPSRPQKLDHKARHEEKTRIVLEHLVTHRITTLAMLSALLGHKSPKICSRFFQSLIKKEYLVRVKHPDVDRKNLVILGNAGARYIDGPERPRTKDHTRIERILNKEQLTHDLQVQKCCLLWVNRSSEIINGRQSRINGLRPDALFFYKNNAVPHAIEYERSKKSHSKIFGLIINYMNKIQENEITGVCFYFANETVMNIYKNAFEKTEWVYGVTKQVENKDGKTITTSENKKVIIPRDDARRKRFAFNVFRVESPPPIVPIEENATPKNVPTLEYAERQEEKNRQKRERELDREAEVEELRRKRIRSEDAQKAKSAVVVKENEVERSAVYAFDFELHRLKCLDFEGEKKLLYFAKAPAFEAKRDEFIARERVRLQAEAAPALARLRAEAAPALARLRAEAAPALARLRAEAAPALARLRAEAAQFESEET